MKSPKSCSIYLVFHSRKDAQSFYEKLPDELDVNFIGESVRITTTEKRTTLDALNSVQELHNEN
jgi:hypothetical protein